MHHAKRFSALIALAGASASALSGQILVAGWDFSQYRAGYSAVGTGYTGVDSLWANFSGLDTLGNANGFSGPNDYHFGTFYYGGQYGSSQMIDAASPFTTYWANSGNLTSNDGAATNPYYGSTFNGTLKNQYLTDEGQETINPYSVQFVSDFSGESFVFEANVGDGYIGNGWGLSYAGKMASGGTTTLSWEYSLDGTNYMSTGITHTFTTTDSAFDLSLADLVALDGADEVYFRGTLGTISSTLGEIPLLDNVAITAGEVASVAVPEPSTYAALGGLFAGALVFWRRRRQA
ncbi:MAG: hypothetical protein E1N59_1543 [Puniceicoccaceae bacterium 5H]|nr:MAG: hypothetical protein E1N59_1543 [Puniceicoccaceae bacterium 5H]